MNSTPQWTLAGFGRLSWKQARHHLDGSTCTWQDLDGLHTGPPPEQAPLATHLWGWTSQCYFRARIDGNDVYLAQLTPAGIGEHVDVTRHAAVMRPPEDTQAPALSLELLEIPGPAPVTFLRPATVHPAEEPA